MPYMPINESRTSETRRKVTPSTSIHMKVGPCNAGFCDWITQNPKGLWCYLGYSGPSDENRKFSTLQDNWHLGVLVQPGDHYIRPQPKFYLPVLGKSTRSPRHRVVFLYDFSSSDKWAIWAHHRNRRRYTKSSCDGFLRKYGATLTFNWILL